LISKNIGHITAAILPATAGPCTMNQRYRSTLVLWPEMFRLPAVHVLKVLALLLAAVKNSNQHCSQAIWKKYKYSFLQHGNV
jgi:hypothetical protein